MDYFKDVKKLGDKLAETLADFNLLHTFDTSKYPITLTVRQNKAPDAQMELFDTTDGRMSSQDSVLRLVFNLDGMDIQTDNRLVISDALMSKVKGLAKKLHYAYLQAYFADRRNAERLKLYGDPDEQEAPDAEAPEDGDEDAFAGFYEDEDPEDGEPAEYEGTRYPPLEGNGVLDEAFNKFLERNPEYGGGAITENNETEDGAEE